MPNDYSLKSLGQMSDAAEYPIEGGQQYAQSGVVFQISPRGNGQYAVINIQTGQTVYSGSLEGARQAQAQGQARRR